MFIKYYAGIHIQIYIHILYVFTYIDNNICSNVKRTQEIIKKTTKSGYACNKYFMIRRKIILFNLQVHFMMK